MSLADSSLTLLDHIRRQEAEIKRCLALEHQAAEARLAEARRRAHDLIVAAEAEGRFQGQAEYRAAQVEAEREAAEIISRARARAEALQTIGRARLEAAVAHSLQVILGGEHAA